jgi:hypothetical protein
MLVQPPSAVVVTVTLIPTGILIILLPTDVPALVDTVPVADTTTLYTPPPLHTPLPTARPGGTQPPVAGQLVGLVTMDVAVPQPLVDVAVSNTLVPVGIPDMILPDMVPADAVTIPLELNVTL